MSRIPMLYPGNREDVIAWREGRAITRETFVREALALAEQLPPSTYLLNHCEDRYVFLLGLAAALLRNQVSLFPSSKAPQVLERLARDYPGVYCLADRPQTTPGMETLVYAPPSSASPPEADLEALAFPADQVVAVAFTSGSTGRPKSYIKTWGGFTHEARVAGRSLGLDRSKGLHVVATVPPQHMYGFLTSVMLPLQHGHIIGADWPFYPEDIARALAARPTPAVLVTTPVHIRACVREKAAFPSLEFILSSTAPLSAELAAEAEAMFGARVEEFYGSTETGAIARRRQADAPVWRTFDDIEVSLGKAGFTVSAPYFYQSPMVLSDSVEVHNGREFMLFGRNADLVKIAGKRILISDLNQHLLAIEGVEDGAFFLPDQEGDREARLMAFVVAPGMSRDEVLSALRERIDAVFLPRPLRLVEALPRNATGKLPRGNLVQLLKQERLAG